MQDCSVVRAVAHTRLMAANTSLQNGLQRNASTLSINTQRIPLQTAKYAPIVLHKDRDFAHDWRLAAKPIHQKVKPHVELGGVEPLSITLAVSRQWTCVIAANQCVFSRIAAAVPCNRPTDRTFPRKPTTCPCTQEEVRLFAAFRE